MDQANHLVVVDLPDLSFVGVGAGGRRGLGDDIPDPQRQDVGLHVLRPGQVVRAGEGVKNGSVDSVQHSKHGGV